MTQIEQILAEIGNRLERLKELMECSIGDNRQVSIYEGKMETLSMFREYISSLPKQIISQPVSEDLEKCVVEQMEADGDVDDFIRRGIDDIASKYAQLGAQWQKERDQKEIQIAEEHGILTGMNMEREKLMKDAIHCKVFWYDGPLLDYTQEQQDDALEKIGAEVGDKVKVIIIKE